MAEGMPNRGAIRFRVVCIPSDQEVPNSMAKEVFISYSSVNADEANALCAAIEATGISCWIAPRDIAPGADWSECIIAGLHACPVFVLLLTEQSNASPQVQR